jgi:hypothetical protein
MKFSTRSLLTFAVLLLLAGPAQALSPSILLTVAEPDLGNWYFSWDGIEYVVVAPGEALDFSWSAEYDVQETVGTIVGYRYGWDVADPNDPYDPNWAYEGLAEVTSAPTQSFSSGAHSLVIRVEDDQGRVTLGRIYISIDASVPDAPTSWSRIKALHDGSH